MNHYDYVRFLCKAQGRDSLLRLGGGGNAVGHRNGKQLFVSVAPDHRPLPSHLWQNFPHLACTHRLPVAARRRGWPKLRSRVISRLSDSDTRCISAFARADRGDEKTGLFFYTHPLTSLEIIIKLILQQWNKNSISPTVTFFVCRFLFVVCMGAQNCRISRWVV